MGDFQSVTGKALTSATTDDMVLYFYCKNMNPRGNCNGIQPPCGRSCGGSSSGTSTGSAGSGTSGSSGTSSGTSSGSITITQRDGSNMWWYAVDVAASSGLTVTALRM